jgi:hypothetical protein
MAPAGSARIVEALGINSGRAKSRRPGAPLETQPGFWVVCGRVLMIKEVGESSNMHMVWVLSVGPQALMEVGVGER